jgi:uncharacterized SAM-binding protein YcdF (DUF218 family)
VLAYLQIPTLLLYPPNLALLVLAAAVVLALLRRRRSALLLMGAGLIWVLVWSLPVTAIFLGGRLEHRAPFVVAQKAPQGDVIVVLGGNTQSNRANWFEPYNRLTAVDRIDRAAELYFALRAPKIIVSGGALEGPVSEAHNMAKALRHKGVPETAIILENDSRNTYENALLSKKLLEHYHLNKVLMVTSALHTPRALATFKKLDIDTIPAGMAPQIDLPENTKLSLWLPHTRSLEASRSIIKEYLGLFGYWLRGWI